MRMISLGRAIPMLCVAGTLAAQAPAPGGAAVAPVARGGSAAQLFLAHTAQLQLNDQQVTRLAAIARRAESREQARRSAMDSLRRRWSTSATDSATRATRRLELANTMRTAMERARSERHADLRDALAVLTPDQQARAWELRGAGRGVRARSVGRRAIRDGQAGPGERRGQLRRGMRSGVRRPL